MAVRTIVLSRHGSNLARSVIIHDIIHGLIYVPSTPYCGFFGVSPDGNCAYVRWGYFTSNSKAVRSHLIYVVLWAPRVYVYSTWQSQAVTHPIMNRARRCFTSVIEQTPMSERRIPYGNCLVSHYVAPVIFCLRGKLIQVKMVLFKPTDLDHFTIETKYTFWKWNTTFVD